MQIMLLNTYYDILNYTNIPQI